MSFCTILFLWHLKLLWNHKIFIYVVYQIWYVEISHTSMGKAQAYGMCANNITCCFHILPFTTTLNKHNLYYNKIRLYRNLLLHLGYIFEFTNVIMACKVQQTQWYAKLHLSRHIQRDRCTSHIGIKISECEIGNVNTWKEHQKLIHCQSNKHVSRLSFPSFYTYGHCCFG
jgi:hypothetical protein